MSFIEINGKKIEAEVGTMIIEVADKLGVQIPRFCYHKKLSIAANCRMCLVDVEKSAKPLPACATPVTDGMKIWTHSPKALLAQKSVMEFLLINHPLDCPICDQGGECELQDISMGFGSSVSRFQEGKRSIKDKNIGPLIATDMTRCIQCTRCVRFGTEVAGMRELGATGRGEHMEIGTFIERSVDSELSGNSIDLCPVGALTSKPFRFTARGWELTQTPSIAPHDCVGSNLYIHSRRQQVMRVVPRENESINEVWLSDRDRFSYQGLASVDRLTKPKVKVGGRWREVSWAEALEWTTKELLDTKTISGVDAMGALISPNATVEECYLLQKLMRGLGINNIDHRLRQNDFRSQERAPVSPTLGIGIDELEQQSVALLIGSDIRKEQPILGLKLRKMTLGGGKVFSINPVDCTFNFELCEKSIVPAGDIVGGVARLAKALLTLSEKKPLGAEQLLKSIKPSEVDVRMAKHLASTHLNEQGKIILVGALAVSHPAFSNIMALAGLIAELSGAKIAVLTEGANSTGAWLAGAVPHRLPGGKAIAKPGLSAAEMWNQGLKSYILFNVDPDLDCANGLKALKALENAGFTIAITPFESQTLRERAHVLLPITPFTETSGTFVNIEGRWQSFQGIIEPRGDSRPGWKVLRILGNLCGVPGFEYNALEEIQETLKAEMKERSSEVLDHWQWWNLNTLELLAPEQKAQVIRIAPCPLNATDGLVRRAAALQQTKDAGDSTVRMNTGLAKDLGLIGKSHIRVIAGDFDLTLSWVIDEAVADKSIVLGSGIKETISLGGPYEAVEIQGV